LDNEIDVTEGQISQSSLWGLTLVHRVPDRNFFPHEYAQPMLKIMLFNRVSKTHLTDPF
jgi:hypothetical protein